MDLDTSRTGTHTDEDSEKERGGGDEKTRGESLASSSPPSKDLSRRKERKEEEFFCFPSSSQPSLTYQKNTALPQRSSLLLIDDSSPPIDPHKSSMHRDNRDVSILPNPSKNSPSSLSPTREKFTGKAARHPGEKEQEVGGEECREEGKSLSDPSSSSRVSPSHTPPTPPSSSSSSSPFFLSKGEESVSLSPVDKKREEEKEEGSTNERRERESREPSERHPRRLLGDETRGGAARGGGGEANGSGVLTGEGSSDGSYVYIDDREAKVLGGDETGSRRRKDRKKKEEEKDPSRVHGGGEKKDQEEEEEEQGEKLSQKSNEGGRKKEITGCSGAGEERNAQQKEKSITMKKDMKKATTQEEEEGRGKEEGENVKQTFLRYRFHSHAEPSPSPSHNDRSSISSYSSPPHPHFHSNQNNRIAFPPPSSSVERRLGERGWRESWIFRRLRDFFIGREEEGRRGGRRRREEEEDQAHDHDREIRLLAMTEEGREGMRGRQREKARGGEEDEEDEETSLSPRSRNSRRTARRRGGGGAGRRRAHHTTWRQELRIFLRTLLAFLSISRMWLVGATRKMHRWIRENENSVLVFIYTILLLITSTGNVICFKKMIDKMPNSSTFLNQLTTVIFIPFFFSVVCYLDFTNNLSQESKEFPKYRFAIMGFLDSLAGIIGIIGAVHTSGTTQVVLQQSGIVFTLIASLLMLNKRFHIAQYIGSVIIILGVLVVKLPDLLRKGGGGGGDPTDGGDVFIFNLLYLLCNVPIALSCVYKEVAFKGVEMDVNYLQAWVALFQFLAGFLVLPFNSLSILGPQSIPLKDLPISLWNGAKCLFGYNTIISECGMAGQPACDNCEGAWVSVSMYVGFNLFYNIFFTLVLKRGGAALMFLVSTLRLPLSAFAFCSPAIVGDSAVPAKATDFYGLAVLLFGLFTYRLGSIFKKRSARRRALRALSASAMVRGEEENEEGEKRNYLPEVLERGSGLLVEEDEEDEDDEESEEEEESDVEAYPVFSSAVASEPPQVRVHAPHHHHYHGDGEGYRRLSDNTSFSSSSFFFFPSSSSSPPTGCRSSSLPEGSPGSSLHRRQKDTQRHQEEGVCRVSMKMPHENSVFFSSSSSSSSSCGGGRGGGGVYQPPSLSFSSPSSAGPASSSLSHSLKKEEETGRSQRRE